jgi:DUF1680 family protein
MSDRPGRLSRRDLLRALGAGTLALGLGGSTTDGDATPSGTPVGAAGRTTRIRRMPRPPVAPAARPMALRDVRLTPGPFHDAQERDAVYLMSLDPDRLLHNFRVNAGLDPKAPVYGGWESQEPWVDIRCHGHSLGHWMTACALLYASTGEQRFEGAVAYAVDELRACQSAGGTGLVCAFPDGSEQLDNAVAGRRIVGVPWYTLHKVFAGLRDAHVEAGNDTALEVLAGLAEWTWNATRPMTDEQLQHMLRVEHGGMNEILADVHVLTGDPRWLELAERFSHRALLEPLAAGRDTLDGLHANTQIPKVIGFHRLWELTGKETYLDAARFFWRTVVRERSFVTGGHGDVEHFFAPREFPEHVHSAKTMETCCTHNMLRLTRALFGTDPQSEYADHYERALYNGILASQDPDTGWNTYFQPTRPGYLKLYHTPIDSFWCCTGTGMENHAKYGDSIYFEGDDGLFVNLFIPSVLTWREKGVTLRQVTDFPEADVVRLEVTADAPVETALHVRIPAWTRGATLRVNGEAREAGARPDGYVSVRRAWAAGDVLEVRLPMGMATEALPGAPDRVAFVYGPIVLAGRLGRDGLYPGADILRNERTTGMILETPVDVPVLAGSAQRVRESVRPVAGAEPLTFETVGVGRPTDVTLIPYHRMHHERYNLYWQLVDGR